MKNILKALLTASFIFCLGLLQSQPYFPVRINKQWGAIDSTGKVILNPAYDKLYENGKRNTFLSAHKGDSVFLLDHRLKIIAKTSYAAIIDIGEGMFETRLRSERYYPSFYGLMDSSGKIISEPRFSLIEPFCDGVAKVNIYTDSSGNYRNENEKSGIIDKRGNWIVPPIYKTSDIKSSSEGLINFYEEGKGWGAMNTTGKVVIQPKYSWLGPCMNGYMEYGLTGEGSTGIMKRDGTVTIRDDGKHLSSYRPLSRSDTLVVVHKLKVVKGIIPYRFIDSKIYTVSGKYVFESPYGPECSQQLNGFFQVSDQAMKRGLMNSSGIVIVEPSYDVLQVGQKGLMQVSKNRKWGFIDYEGKEIIPCIYEDTKSFQNGLAAIYVGGRWSDYIFPDKYPNVKMGYINRSGKVIWEPSW